MKKKVFATLLAASLAIASLAGCGSTETSTSTATASTETSTEASTETSTEAATTDAAATYAYDITVWVPEAAVDLTQKEIDDFNASNTDGITLTATIEAVSEADAATTMLNDVEAGADIYFFAQDQAARLIQAGALAKLGDGAKETVTANNDASAVAAVMAGDEMYAYPLTADNGYFMFYDKSVIPDSDIDSLEALIADCEAAGRNFAMENETSAWYLASWFFATGCNSTWQTDDDGNIISITDDFNSDNGLIAAKGMYKLVTSPYYVSSSSADEFTAAVPAAVLVSGNWNTATIRETLGDNMGVADLPSFEVDGVSYHMGSYNGCKLLGVKPQADAAKAACLHKLAQYLTSTDVQLERYTELSWGPSDITAQQDEAVKADVALQALIEQNQYSKTQGQIHGSWWDIAKVIGTEVKESDGSDEALKQALQNYEDTCAGLFTMSDEEKNKWTAIGTLNGTNWDTDFDLVDAGDGIYKLEGVEMTAGTEFKVRQGLSWDVNYGKDGVAGGDNVVVEADGTYTIVFDSNTGMITLE